MGRQHPQVRRVAHFFFCCLAFVALRLPPASALRNLSSTRPLNATSTTLIYVRVQKTGSKSLVFLLENAPSWLMHASRDGTAPTCAKTGCKADVILFPYLFLPACLLAFLPACLPACLHSVATCAPVSDITTSPCFCLFLFAAEWLMDRAGPDHEHMRLESEPGSSASAERKELWCRRGESGGSERKRR